VSSLSFSFVVSFQNIPQNQHRDHIAYRVLGLSEKLMVTRRWFYLIPADGEPQKLVHKIESGHLDSLPGKKRTYAAWQELFEALKQVLSSYRNCSDQRID